VAIRMEILPARIHIRSAFPNARIVAYYPLYTLNAARSASPYLSQHDRVPKRARENAVAPAY